MSRPFVEVLIRLRPAQAAGGLVFRSRVPVQARFVSQKTVAGSKGRTMPVHRSRATAPVKNLDATFTIRVCFSPLLPPTCHVLFSPQ
ncbi:hypothetical protein VTK73DRAFT_1451 [Phialemonium thermophilum]|uniref:Uncharacterized protein n=1 Tax=Phialemonium thermophilum TaxID=223376 RepID=A0ABR3VTI8_9PEZI